MTAPPDSEGQDIPLLTTKLYIPPPHPNLVPRPRLIEQLDEGLRLGHRLTLVSAPAGFGKTVLIAEWLQRLQAAPLRGPSGDPDQPGARIHAASKGHTFAWLSLDEEDNDLARFFTYLVAAIERVHAGVGTDARALFQSPQPPPLKSALATLINRLATVPTDLVLVLDDYHVIKQQSIHDGLIFLLDYLPPQMHLVVAGRADPPWPLARLRTRSQLTELRAADLRFTPDEAAVFLNDTMELRISGEDVAALEARTEGWIAGLQLAALSMRDKAANRISDFIAVFSGSNRHVIDYLAEEVLAQQPAEIHDFLCQTAILDRLTAPLCDAVTGRNDSDAILRQLEQANLFLVPLDDQRKWYRYHRLFADFLRNHLHQDMPGLVRDLHCWAADWYEHNGLATEAVGHVLKVADTEWAARLIEQTAPTLLMHGEATRLLAWLKALPEPLVRSRPQLCISWAEALAIGGQMDDVETFLRDAERDLQPGDTDLLGQTLAIRAYLAVFQGDLSRAAELAQQASRILPDSNTFARPIVTWLLGFTKYFDEGMAEARRAFLETLELSRAAGSTFIALLSTFTVGYLHVLQGHLRQAREIFWRGLQLAEVDSRRPSAGESERPSLGISLVYQGLGEVSREQNDLESADRYLTEGIELGEQWGNAEVLADSYALFARVKQAQGDAQGADETIAKAEQLGRENRVSPLTARQVDAHRARLWVARGKLGAAARWAASLEHTYEAEGNDSGQVILFMRQAEQSTLARLLIARREFAQAASLLAPLLQEVEAAGWMGVAIELLALQALALQGQGNTTEALAALHRALSLGEPGSYVRVFVDLGAPMAALLRQAAAQGDGADYVSRLLGAFESPVPSFEASGWDAAPRHLIPETQGSETLIDPLSERELEVLRLIAAGLSNREIADRLTITVGTAKRHVSNIYGKLDVHSRVQAVARARDLYLL